MEDHTRTRLFNNFKKPNKEKLKKYFFFLPVCLQEKQKCAKNLQTPYLVEYFKWLKTDFYIVTFEEPEGSQSQHHINPVQKSF